MRHPRTFSAIRRALLAAALASTFAQAAAAAPASGTPQRVAEGAGKTGSAAGYRELSWDDLMPPGWDPMKVFDMRELGSMSDGDPRARELMTKLRQAWDNAPVRQDLQDANVRLSGYVVPLETDGKAIRQFLLVPYFGACIHVPPPPANQVVHVVLDQPAHGVQVMAAVSVSGRMQVLASSTEYGKASYRIDGRHVALQKP